MDLRTTFQITPSREKISYSHPVMFIGSCFANSIGQKFEMGRMPVMINPAGTVYNPVSVCTTLDGITGRKIYDSSCIYNNEGTWISFDHYTDFASERPEELLKKINRKSGEALKFISDARFLFITFGTSRVYRWKETGKIVSNCHKIPSSKFVQEVLSLDLIVSLWTELLDNLHSQFPHLHVVFTISPVRHWKDGAHGNQISKSILFLAVEKLLEHSTGPEYFPAYELVMDDLRDYRFYDDDMLHLSASAIDYIWDAFCDCYFERETLSLWNEVNKISKAIYHRIQTDSKEQIFKFAENIISKIDSVTSRYQFIDLKSEKAYFLRLLESR